MGGLIQIQINSNAHVTGGSKKSSSGKKTNNPPNNCRMDYYKNDNEGNLQKVSFSDSFSLGRVE